MRSVVLSILLVAAGVCPSVAQSPFSKAAAAFEIVKKHSDIELHADGSFLDADEVAIRALTEQGAQALRQTTLSFTQGYQSFEVKSAYTLKADGTRLDVPPNSILYGHGATTAPGFEDLKTMTIVFPNLEAGDQIVLVTLFRQDVPWFKNHFSNVVAFSRAIAVRDEKLEITAPADYPLFIDAAGVEGGERETVGGKNHWSWRFHNDAPVPPESGAVTDIAGGPHVVVSSFPSQASAAQVYAELFRDRAEVTPEIQALADRLTAGTADRREQARLLYEWVSTHISYVAIVLGAGGFVPHRAAQVLENRYGDCKDHVMLLEALLAAKGIQSSAALINTDNTYRLTSVATPFAFDHLITYVPELKLYLDSTARFAPFGVLPISDSGKPVLLVASGEVARTPVGTARESTLRSVETLKIAKDGSAVGDTKVDAAGPVAVDMRAAFTAIPPDKEADYFRYVMGPDAEGTLDRGNIGELSQHYVFGAHYRLTNLARFPGPGALPGGMAYKPFSFGSIIADTLPPTRTRDYVCPAVSADEDLTVELPPGTEITFLPKSEAIETGGIRLQTSFQSLKGNVIHEQASLRIEHPEATCSPDYYARVRGGLERMLGALRAQIIYK